MMNTHTRARIPKPEHEDVMESDREGTANRPDIINTKKCLLIDVAILSDRNYMQKEAEKKLK